MTDKSPWPSSLGASFAAFVVGPLVCAFGYSLFVGVRRGFLSPADVLGSTADLYMLSLVFGFLPFLLIGVPLFGYLRLKGRASYLSVALVGILPGLAATAFLPWQFGAFFAGFGVIVALLAQVFAVLLDKSRTAA